MFFYLITFSKYKISKCSIAEYDPLIRHIDISSRLQSRSFLINPQWQQIMIRIRLPIINTVQTMGCASQKEKRSDLKNYPTNKPLRASLRRHKKTIQLVNFERCKMCGQFPPRDQSKTILQCGHEHHTECIIRQALDITDGTLDPVLLATFSCGECNLQISPFYFEGVMSRQKIQGVIEGINQELAQRIHEQEREKIEWELENRLYDCEVCLEKFKISDIITLDCEHRFCKDCVKLDLETQIGEGKFSEEEIGCPACRKGGINEQLLRNCIGKEKTDRLIDFRHKQLRVQGVSIFHCLGYLKKVKGNFIPLVDEKPLVSSEKRADQIQRICRAIRRGEKPKQISEEVKQCPGIHSFAEGDHGSQIKCPVCALQMCVRGCPVTHKGTSCEEYKKSAKLNEMEDGGFAELLKAGVKMTKCPNPKCRVLIERINGCDWVKCKCQFEMCYVCGIAWEWNCPHGQPGNGHPKFDVAAFMKRYG